MEMIMYQSLDSENVINKDLEMKYSFNIKLKNNTDITNPIILLNDKKNMDFRSCNYCYLEEFGRFYFIRSIESINNDVWRLQLECDVLESFKTDILNSTSEITRNVKEGDYQSVNVDSDIRKTTSIYHSDVVLTGEKEIILTTIGGV